MKLPAFLAIGFMLLVTLRDCRRVTLANGSPPDVANITALLLGVVLLALLWLGGTFDT